MVTTSFQTLMKFANDSLRGKDVLIISNALGELKNDNNNSTSAFTKPECDAVYEWVGRGGSLFLIADHGPMGDAAAPLAQRFGVTLGNGFVFDTNYENFTDSDPTELVFSEQNHLLGKHAITLGRDSSEGLHKLVAFTESPSLFREVLSRSYPSRPQLVKFRPEQIPNPL